MRQTIWWAITVLLLLAIVGLRTAQLEHVPPGLTHDEASNAHDAAAILQGVHRIYFPVGYGHEPLYNYSLAIMTAALGQSIFTLRLTTVAWALVQSIMTAALARRWWGRRATLVVLAAYAISFWAQMMARVGLRAPTLPALLAISAWAYDHASTTTDRRKASRWYSMTGVVLGLSIYTYMASRGMPFLFIGYLLSTKFLDPRKFRQIQKGTLWVLLLAFLVAAPLLFYLLRHPGLEQRIAQLGSALHALREGNPGPLARNIASSLPMLVWRGDSFWLYNVAGRPGLEPLLAGAFLVGVIQAISHLHNDHHRFLLWWLAAGVAPALLAPPAYNLLHAIAAMPAVFLLTTNGALAVARRAARLSIRRQAILALLGILVTVGSGMESGYAYFSQWAGQRDVRVAYHHHVVALSRWLETNGEPQMPTVLTTLYPGKYHDPYIVETVLQREDLNIHWVDGRWALFIPREMAQLAVEAQTQPPPILWALVAPDIEWEATLRFRPDDIPPDVSIYRWAASSSWERWASEAQHRMFLAAGDPPPREVTTDHSAPAIVFAGTLTLDGYTLACKPNGDGSRTLYLVTGWEVLAPIEDELAIFVHVLDAAGNLIAQDDRLAAPTWQWREKDRFLHLHQIHIPADALASPWAAVGVYRRPDITRLEIISPATLEQGEPSATRALIPLGGAPP